MPRGQYTRKAPAAKAAAADQATEPDVEETADGADTIAAVDDDTTEVTAAGDSEASAAEPTDSGTSPEADEGDVAVSADSADNVLYPVDDNPAARPAPLCPACFPVGWPAGAEQTVGCEHGLWLREWPPAGQDAS